MSQPRIAVIGGGIAGTMCSLVLKNRGLHPVLIDQGTRGLGGRLRGGAQFIRASDPRLAQVTAMLEQQGLLKRWQGRFGVLGSSDGGFLPAEIVTQQGGQQASTASDNPGSSSRATASDGGDFCNFVEGSLTPTYVGVPSMADLCPEICRLADIESVSNTQVVGAAPVPEGGWKLDTSGSDDIGGDTFDAMVVATHDPSLAGGMVRRIVDAEVAAGGSTKGTEDDQSAALVIRKLTDLSDSLQALRDHGRLPVYTLFATYPAGFSDKIPFDAASVPGSHHIQFISRHASGHSDISGDTWHAVTTSMLAAELLSSPQLTDDEKRSSISGVASEEVSRLLLPFHGEPGLLPLDVSVKRWGSAFSSRGLNLKEDSVTLAPWRLAICGDFVRDMSEHATPIEAAALSGLEAGERTASLFSS
mmetsp:Transcript_23180/g.38363  ORF Transcript_23180/g.38363 Transcript_23180/m.38363 type:complete len:417 (+) Transcript_23180:95-1345(+)